MQISGFRIISPVLILGVLSGCANFGTPVNEEVSDSSVQQRYSLADWEEGRSSDDVLLILTFSGGGTRAAALSYGVMQELRDTKIGIDGRSTRLLDEVDHISSVSGGSFTSAYYGLAGDGIFENYEEDFLRFDLEKRLIWRALNPALLFSSRGRTDAAIEYYQAFLFKDATFADMIHPDRPLIIINASDLGYGIRFSYVQEYFDLLCSELSSYPVADAVAASSAVPVVFTPVVLENHDNCSEAQLTGITSVREHIKSSGTSDVSVMLSQLATYEDKENRKFIHLVDGGITDNLGIRAILDIMAVAGGIDAFAERHGRPSPSKVAVIMVDANTQPNTGMNQSAKQPSTVEVVSSVSGVQLARFDADSVGILQEKINQWEAESTTEKSREGYFVKVRLQDITDRETLDYFNAIPTSFKLENEQVDKLIAAGRNLLRNNPVFQELLSGLENN